VHSVVFAASACTPLSGAHRRTPQAPRVDGVRHRMRGSNRPAPSTDKPMRHKAPLDLSIHLRSRALRHCVIVQRRTTPLRTGAGRDVLTGEAIAACRARRSPSSRPRPIRSTSSTRRAPPVSPRDRPPRTGRAHAVGAACGPIASRLPDTKIRRSVLGRFGCRLGGLAHSYICLGRAAPCIRGGQRQCSSEGKARRHPRRRRVLAGGRRAAA